MVLGSKKGLSQSFYQALQSSGTLHVVVASGMNVMLIAGATASLLSRLLRRQSALVLALISIWLYVFLAGFDAPLIRAGLMGSLSFIGLIFGRFRQAGRLLIFSTLGMLLWRPVWAFDVGFQLSVTATAGLIWISPLLKPSKPSVIARSPDERREDAAIPWKIDSKSRRRSRSYFGITRKFWYHLTHLPLLGDSLVTTLAAQIAVWPILAHHFHTLSVISPLINALVLWIVAPVTQLGMLIGLISIPFEPLTNILIWITWPLLTYFTNLVKLSSQLPLNLITLESFPPYLLVSYYSVLVLIIRRFHASNPTQISQISSK
jgi:competence protein ComEC